MATANSFLLERWTRVAPLGVRFWDVSFQCMVMDGLVVTAKPLEQPTRLVQATMSSGGIFGFARLPLVKPELVFGEGDKKYWDDMSAADQRDYLVTVIDMNGRFLPCNFVARAPLKGVFDFSNTGDVIPRVPAAVPLFSNSARRVLSVLGTAYVTLEQGNKPVKYAIVQVVKDGAILGTGMSDERGAAVVTFPYPDLVAGTPLFDAPGEPVIHGQKWEVKIQVLRNPADVVTADKLPDIVKVMKSDQELLIEHVTDATFTVKYGIPLVVRS